MVGFGGRGSWGVVICPKLILPKRCLSVAVKTMWESGMQNMTRVWWSELSLEEEEARRWHLFGLLPLLSTDGSNELTLTKKLKTEVLAGLKELARGYAEIPTPRDLLCYHP